MQKIIDMIKQLSDEEFFDSDDGKVKGLLSLVVEERKERLMKQFIERNRKNYI